MECTLSPEKPVERMSQEDDDQEAGVWATSEMVVDASGFLEPLTHSLTQSHRQERLIPDSLASSRRIQMGVDESRTSSDAVTQTSPDCTHEAISQVVIQSKRTKELLAEKEVV